MTPTQQILRTYRTACSRREAAQADQRAARRLLKGARRANRRMVRLMAEYLGVGEPCPRLVVLFYRGRREVFSL